MNNTDVSFIERYEKPHANGKALDQKEDHAHVDGAFRMAAISEDARDAICELQRQVNEVVVPVSGEPTEEELRQIREKTLYLIPARNEERRIPVVLNYLLKEYEIPADRVLVSSGSTDRTDDVVRSHGVEVCRQWDVLKATTDVQKLLAFQQANSLEELAGKGTTLTAGLLHWMATGTLNAHNAKELHVAMLDSDPHHYARNDYDPIGNFAKLRMQHGGETMKPAKNGASRNNQPVYTAANTIGMVGSYGRSLSRYMGSQPWLLSGEMQRRGDVSQQLVMSTGYPVETTMNISDHDLKLRARHYADHRKRGDTSNDLEKETVMYGEIQRVMQALVLYAWATKKRLVDCGINDVIRLNEIVAFGIDDDEHIETSRQPGVGMPLEFYVRDETNDYPNPPRVALIEPKRIIGSIGLLVREQIAHVDAW